MITVSFWRMESKQRLRRVSFTGADVIEYDAALAPVVRLCGVFSHSADVTLECKARGLECEQQVATQYVEELQQFLRLHGFEPMSNDLTELQTQRQVIDLLTAWSFNADVAETDADVLNPVTLHRAQLAKKQLEGRVDDDYVFGRRFLSVATYVETLSREELLKTAKDLKVELPHMDEQQRSAVKVLDRELLGLHGTAQGRRLKSLTLRQLVTEAKARGVMLDEKKEKKSKRAWANMLKPLIAAEIRASKIQEQEESMLRDRIVPELEREKKREQQQRIVQLIKVMTHPATKLADEIQECTEPEDDDAIMRQENVENCKNVSEGNDKARAFLSALAMTMRISSEYEENVDMKE